MPGRIRRWNGWGFEGEVFPLAEPLRAWLDGSLGRGDGLRAVSEGEVPVPPARPLPVPPQVAVDDGPSARLRHACGQSFPDLVALRRGTPRAFPDAVFRPADAAEVGDVLRWAAGSGVGVVVRGGGTSVVGGVTVTAGDRPTVVLSLERLAGLVSLDATSGLAAFGAGTPGPEVDAALAPHGFRLGHEPQSYELSTVGGWIAARSAGQRSTGIGRIEALLAGVEVVTPRGAWHLPARPASAAGPDLRQLVLGSEGRAGVITEATLRVRPLPAVEEGCSVLLPGWEAGVAVCRTLMQRGVPVEVLRLSDVDETAFAVAVLHLSAPLRRAFAWLLRRRRFRRGCILLLGWAGGEAEVGEARARAAATWREAGGVSLGARGWRGWRRDRFQHPYLREALFEEGWGLDTFETAAPWSLLDGIHRVVTDAVAAAAARLGTRCALLCHLSHAYRDGASLYFTFLWPLRAGEEVAAWGTLKEAATAALLAAGGTVTHHHGVGTMHEPWVAAEWGAPGCAALEAALAALDPSGTMNPGVLIREGGC